IGTFLALDFFLFYIFWEVMLLPMYFLIGIWGGPRREYAAIKFFLFTLLGSVFILIAMLGFYFTDVRDVVSPAMIKNRLQQSQHKFVAEPGAVNTFDMIILAKAGKVAMEHIRGTPVEKLDNGNLPGWKAAKTKEQKDAVKKRLEQGFFQPAWQYAFFLLLF